MSQYSSGLKAFTAGEDIEARSRVKKSGATVIYADAGEDFIGVTEAPVDDGDLVTVKLKNVSGTFKMRAAGAFSANALLYGAASGEVNDTVSGEAQFYALEAATAADDIIEALPWDVSSTGPISIGAGTVGIDCTGLLTSQVLDYTTTTSVGETTDAHLIRYGTSAAPIIYTPTTGGSHSGIQMHITAADAPTGLSLAAVRAYVTYTGTAKATAYGGLFWMNLNTTSYTGDYLGGTPAGVQGVIQVEGTVAAANDHAWYCGVAGEVRPLGTVTKVGVISAVRAVLNTSNSAVMSGVVAGVHVGAYNGTVDTGVLVLPHVGSTFTTGVDIDSQYGTITTGIDIAAVTTGIDFTGLVSSQVIDYTTATSVGETTDAHLIRYGTSGTPIIYTPTTGGSHSGIQMHITAADAPTGLSLAGIRSYVTYTGTAKATAYGGLFWMNLNTTSYTGDYLGGTPAGVQGVIQVQGTVAAANDHAWYCGVAGEVRPLGTITKVGVISGLRAVLNANNEGTFTGVLAGVHVGAYYGVADVGVLVLPHVGSTFTTGLNIDTQYGTITKGIEIGDVADASIVFGTPTNEIFRFDDDQTICSDDNGSILANISGTANDGFIKVVVGSADKYIALYDLKSS